MSIIPALAQFPSITCSFTASVPVSPCASNIVATITYTNLPSNTAVSIQFPNTIALGSSTGLSIAPVGDGQYYTATQSLTGNGTLTIPMSLSNCTMNGSGPSFGGNLLSFDCFFTVPNGTVAQAALTGSSGATFNPDGGSFIQFPVNNNPISLSANPSTQGFTQIGSAGARDFIITLNSPDVSSFIWDYTPESDIISSPLPISNGINQVNNLNFANNQLTLPESYTWVSCIGGGGQASVTIDCPDPCPDIVRTASVDAFYINTPPSFSITSTNQPTDFSVNGCDHEYIFKYRVSISPSQPITLESFIIPINEAIYPVQSVTINGAVPNYPIDIIGDGFDVEVTTDFNCDYFAGCGQTNNLLYNLFQQIELSYTRPCFPNNIVNVNLPVPNANAGQEFLGTFLGGAQDLDYSPEHPTIPVFYEFMTSTGLQFGLNSPNECTVSYQLVLSAEDAFGDHVSISNTGPTNFSNDIIIPINSVQNHIYNSIPLELTFDDCPYTAFNYNPLFPFSGPVTLHAEIQAYCPECPTCFRTLRCIEQTIVAHCTGECTGPVGTLDIGTTPKPDIKRVTFGWATEQDYISAQNPLTNIGSPDDSEVNQLLKTFYPYDIFEIVAYGHADIGENVGFEIAYPSVPGITFELIEGKFCSPTDDNLIFNNFDDVGCFSTNFITGEVFGYPDEQFIKQRIWYGCELPDSENFKFRARFRVKNNRAVGFIENEFRLQFISNGTLDVNNSCDSYGHRLTFLSPGYDFDNGSLPVNSIPINNEDLQLQLDVKNNPLFNQPQNLNNSNTDLCRTSVGLLVSGFGAKGGNELDFPYEYRPMIDWPSRPEDQETDLSYTQFNNVVKVIYQPTNLNTTDYADNLVIDALDPSIAFLKNPVNIDLPILPPIETSNTLVNVNGVYLELKGECANDNISVTSELFRFYHHAYVNHASFKLHPDLDPINSPPVYPTDEVFHEKPFATTEDITASLNFDFQTILQTPTYLLNGNNYNLPIAILKPTVPGSNGLVHPELQNLLVYYNLTYANGSPLQAEDISFVGPVITFEQSVTNALNPSGFSYYFDDAIDFSVVAQLVGVIPVSLACNENTYMLHITMVHFCEEEAYLDYLTNGTNDCQIYERDLILNPSEPTAVNHTSSTQLINTDDDCYLEWTVTITNSAGNPEIIKPNFIFNTPNGLILETQNVLANYFYPIDNTASTILPLLAPTFSLSAMASPFAQNSFPTYSLTPEDPSFILQGNAKIVYTLRFKFSTTLCLANLSSFNILGRFTGIGVCTDIEANDINLTAFIQPFGTITPTGNCCVQPPVSVNVINACPGQNGSIIITPTNGSSLTGVTYNIINTQGNFQSGNFDGPVAPISLPIGFYAVLVTLSNGNQMTFNANIQNGELSLQITSLANTVCQNTPFTASVVDINPLNTPPYTYTWADAIGANIGNQNPYTTQNPIAGNYSVNVVNTLTGCRASLPFTINVDQPPSNANAGINQTICTNTITLGATLQTSGVGVWSGPNSAITFTDPNIINTTVNGLFAGNNTLTWTVSSGVCAPSVSTVTINVQTPPTANAGVDQTICGATATLAATAVAGGTWSLVLGTGTFATVGSANTAVTGLSTGANVFRWTISNGICPAVFDEVSIISNSVPVITLQMPQNVCNDQIFNINVSPSGGQLIINSELISGNAFSTNSIQSSLLQIGNNNVNYTFTNNSGCISTANSSLHVEETCPCEACTDANVGIIEPIQVNSYEDIVSQIGVSVINRCIFIASDIYITDFLYFQNCTITVASGIKIEVTPSGSMHIDKSMFKGCDRMWVGIKNYGKVRMSRSIIKDAHIGFEMMRGPTHGAFSAIHKNTFSNNFIGLANSLTTGFHQLSGPGGCTFLGGALLPGYEGQEPAPNPLGGHAGIIVLNGFYMPIDYTNSFKNLYNGIIAFRSSIKVDKAVFVAIQHDPANLLYPNTMNNMAGIMQYWNHPSFPSAAINAGYGSRVSVTGLGTDDQSDVMFYGCRNSITNHRSVLSVRDVKIDGEDEMSSEIGIRILNNTNGFRFVVSNNRIRARRTGIMLEECGNFIGSTAGVIHNNNITILDNFDLSQPDFISMNSFKFGIRKTSQLNSSAIKLSENTINIQSWQPNVGVYINQSPGIQISSNFVRRYTPSIGFGIGIENNQSSTVSCNSSIGMDSDVMNVRNEAFTIWNSKLTLVDNYSNLTQTGFSFNENCAGIAIENNEMENHSYNPNTTIPSGALYLGLNADIGDQIDEYNRFTTENSWAIRHPLNVSENFFFVDPSYQSPVFYPQHDPANLSDCTSDPFFVCPQNPFLPPLPSDPCGTSTTGSTILGMAIANPGGTIGLAEAAAKREISYPVFDEESRFSLEKTLEQGLKEGSIILPDTGVFITWKDSLYASNASKLNDYSRTIHSENNDSAHIQLADQWKSAAQLAFDSSMTWLSEIDDIEDFETDLWLQRQIQLNFWQTAADSLQEELKIADENRILSVVDSAEAKNQQVTMERDYETMERTINEIYLQTLARGIFDYTAEQWSTISLIAWQCPLKSASAVYKARGMYGIVEPFTRFDNYSICASQGMQYRLAQENEKEQTLKNQEMYLFPNPSNHILNIELTNNTGMVHYQITNTLGQMILSWENENLQQVLNLINLGLSNGLYYVQAKSADGKTYQQKFVYQKQ